ncbi:MAG: hypothetical protein GXO27_05665, partial [Chlorobi bacterium]|nr:hypothetical protein [Chlorobiota bacterium]
MKPLASFFGKKAPFFDLAVMAAVAAALWAYMRGLAEVLLTALMLFGAGAYFLFHPRARRPSVRVWKGM